MEFEILVTKDNTHFFATDIRSISSLSALAKKFQIIKEKFPESEGYKVTATQWQTTGRDFDMDSLIHKNDSESFVYMQARKHFGKDVGIQPIQQKDGSWEVAIEHTSEYGSYTEIYSYIGDSFVYIGRDKSAKN